MKEEDKETEKSSTVDSKADLILTFNSVFSPIETALLDSESWFSISAMWAELSEVESLAGQLDPYSREIARWYFVLTLLSYKSEYAEDVLRYGEFCLTIQEEKMLYNTYEFMGIYSCIVKSALLVETNKTDEGYENEVNYKTPSNYVKRVIRISDLMIDLHAIHRLGLRKDLGFYLHEEKQFQQALEVNKQTLIDAEIDLGENNSSLTELVVNLAQNSYELKEFTKTKSYLLRALNLASSGKRINYEFDILFQLGILAHELGDTNTALDWFKAQLEVAKREEDESMIEEALCNIRELRKRIERM